MYTRSSRQREDDTRDSPTYRRGMTLLLAVVVTSLLLTIGISIMNITFKELVLSSTGRESQFAFYAADSGLECALYWDRNQQFPTSTDSASPSSLYCADVDITASDWNVSNQTSNSATTQFRINFPAGPYCVDVWVVKDSSNPSTPNTRIESRGRNTCDTSNPKRVERALRTAY